MNSNKRLRRPVKEASLSQTISAICLIGSLGIGTGLLLENTLKDEPSCRAQVITSESVQCESKFESQMYEEMSQIDYSTLAPTSTPVPTVVPEEQEATNSYGDFNPDSKIFKDFSKEDRFVIYRIVEAEATSQGYQPKKNVAAVVFNRIKSDEFPNTAYGVVFEKHQFSPTSDGRYWKVSVTEETKQAVIDAYEEGYDAEGATFFANIADVKNLRTKMWFKSLQYLFGDKSGHTFYK